MAHAVEHRDERIVRVHRVVVGVSGYPVPRFEQCGQHERSVATVRGGSSCHKSSAEAVSGPALRIHRSRSL